MTTDKIKLSHEVERLGKKTKMGYMIETEPFYDITLITTKDLTTVSLFPSIYKNNNPLGIHHREIKFLTELHTFKNNMATVVKIENLFPMEIGYIFFEDFNYAVVYSPYIPKHGNKLICSLYFNDKENQILRIKKKLSEFYFPRCDIETDEYLAWKNALTKFVNIYGLTPKDYL